MNKKFDVIITPHKLSGQITPISSKSHLHRLLIAAAFCDKKTTIKNVSFSEDIIATLDALKSIGSNFVTNKNEVVFDGFLKNSEAVIDCKECGSTFRFFIPICAMLGIKTKFLGSKRLGERGYSDIVTALGESVSFDKTFGLPLQINGEYKAEEICISGKLSSQFISGIMLGAYAAKKDIDIHIVDELSSSSYVDMTIDVLKDFGVDVVERKNHFKLICGACQNQSVLTAEIDYSNLAFWEVGGVHLPIPKDNSKQGDKIVLDIVKRAKNGVAFDIDIDKIPDLAPIFGVLLANLKGVSTLQNCARLRAKECDRLCATAEVLTKFGIKADIVGDNLKIEGGVIKGDVVVDSYGDHRMAMMIAILASFADGKVTLTNAQVVKKSYPTFWEDYIALGGQIDVINIR